MPCVINGDKTLAGSILGNLWRSSLIAIWKFFSLERMAYHFTANSQIVLKWKRGFWAKKTIHSQKKGLRLLFSHISAFYLVDNVFVILKRHVCERMFKLTEICILLKKGADPKETILLLNSSVTWCHFRKNGGHIAHPPPCSHLLLKSADWEEWRSWVLGNLESERPSGPHF